MKFEKISKKLNILNEKIVAKEVEMQLKDAEFHDELHELSFRHRTQGEMIEKKKEILQLKFVKFWEKLKTLKQKIVRTQFQMQLKDAEFHGESDELSFKDPTPMEMREKNEILKLKFEKFW